MGFKSFFIKAEDAEAEVKQEQLERGEIVEEEEISDTTNENDLKFSPAIIQQASTGSVVGVFDKNIYEQLSTAITEQDLPGDDYLEFKAALKKLAAYIPDEGKLYKATFESLDLTAESLLKSLTHYIDVVDGEKEKFKIGLQSAVEEQVGKKETELQEITDKRAALKTKTKEIEAEITGLNEYENTVSSDLQQAKTKLMVTDANFTVTAEKLTSQLTGDSVKIENHLATEVESTK